jgi:ElaB/YqjD/DUF883 family membrane-anchored ribosome-binding protein
MHPRFVLPSTAKAAQFAGAAFVASLLMLVSACGGGGGNESAASVAPPLATNVDKPPTLQSASGADGTTIAQSSDDAAAKADKDESTRLALLDFEGKVTEGPSKDTELKGKLILNGKSADGGKTFTIEGKLISRTKAENQPMLTDAQRAALDALVKKFEADVQVRHEKFRNDVSALVEKTEALLKPLRDEWLAVDPKAADAKAKYEAIASKAKVILEDFRKALGVLKDAFEADMKALRDTFEADVEKIVPGGLPGKKGVSVIPVTGTLAEDGSIKLTFDLGATGKIEGTGKRDAEGKYTGTFTGPAAADKGTWSAEPRKRGPGDGPRPPGAGNMGCMANVVIVGSIKTVSSASAFTIGTKFIFGPYKDGFPIDAAAAKFVNGTAADVAVGKAVRVCTDQTVNLSSSGAATPIKADTVEFRKER